SGALPTQVTPRLRGRLRRRGPLGAARPRRDLRAQLRLEYGAGGESVHPRSAAKRRAARSYLRIDRRPVRNVTRGDSRWRGPRPTGRARPRSRTVSTAKPSSGLEPEALPYHPYPG